MKDTTDLTLRARHVLGSLPAWWADQSLAAGLTGKWLDVQYALQSATPSGAACPTTPLLSGLSPHDVGDTYVNALSPAVRAHNGRHYTPLRLAEELWGQVRRSLEMPGEPSPLPGLVHDPAVGGGTLLLPPLREHLQATRDWTPQDRIDSVSRLVSGSDMDPAAVYVANVVLAAELLPILAMVPEEERLPLPALCSVADGLAGREQKAAAIVMNPPYGRVKLSPEERKRFSDSVYGHANLYGLFMAAAVGNLAEGGALAALVPTSFMAGLYFQNLRAKLSSEAPLQEVAFVADRSGVFSTDVLQETCLATFKKGGGRPSATVSRIADGAIHQFLSVPFIGGCSPWILPRRSSDLPAIEKVSQMPSTFASLGWKVSTGPLVWNRKKDQIHATPTGEAVRILWGADVDGGVVHQDPARDKQRFFEVRTEAERSVLVLEKPAVLLQRTTSPEQVRRLVVAPLDEATLAAWDGKVIVENHVNVATCAPESIVAPDLMARILATSAMDRVLRCITGSVAVSAYEIESLPFPEDSVLLEWASLDPLDLERAVEATYFGDVYAQIV